MTTRQHWRLTRNPSARTTPTIPELEGRNGHYFRGSLGAAVASMLRQFPGETFTIQDWSGSGLVIYSEGIATADQLGDSRDGDRDGYSMTFNEPEALPETPTDDRWRNFRAESVKLSKEMKKAHRIEPVEDEQFRPFAEFAEQEGFGTIFETWESMPYGP